jgi:hypothetical protein
MLRVTAKPCSARTTTIRGGHRLVAENETGKEPSGDLNPVRSKLTAARTHLFAHRHNDAALHGKGYKHLMRRVLKRALAARALVNFGGAQ